MQEIKDLIEISRYYGKNKDYTLAGGGNTSYKNKEHIWIKASGATLATITEEGFAQLSREKVRVVGKKQYSDDEQQREVEVKMDLIAANVFPEKGKRPSVETSFHELIDYAFVVHMHPTITNALMCANDSEKITRALFGDEAIYIGYAPGYPLFMKVNAAIEAYRKDFPNDPKLIFLENHGVFVSADTIGEIKELYTYVTDTIKKEIKHFEEIREKTIGEDVEHFLPHIRAKLSVDGPLTLHHRHNSLHEKFYSSEQDFQKASLPFTPDIIVYCKSAYLFLEETTSPDSIKAEFDRKLEVFIKQHGYYPKIILMKDYGLVAAGENAVSAEISLEVYEDLLKVSYYSESFGGPRFLGTKEIEFIDNWEVENYRRKISKGEGTASLINNKTVVITGAAQGFGAGIAEEMILAGANVIVADLNEEKGMETASSLASLCNKNTVKFRLVDVANPESMDALVTYTVQEYGGIDVFISNAGILFAGGVDELSPAVFSKMTEVNYNAWFYAVRSASAVMKIQQSANDQMRGDLIQINSKSGLQGSNRNFAYAGAKFGGIGLTQSFAMELAPFGIKVNSVCPGNFFEGPLWADSENGLFVQYLKAGKVPGAKTIDDVKKFYEKKVPLKRGCRVDDVMKAILYIINQEYETGQAIPVTGGQVMLK